MERHWDVRLCLFRCRSEDCEYGYPLCLGLSFLFVVVDETAVLQTRCTFTAEHGKKIGWKPQFAPEHILESAEEEVGLILQELEGASGDNSRLLRQNS